jgi:hypothetical protein
MPDQRLLSLARDCRDRAEEILIKGDAFEDAHAKQKMCEIAVKYEELAERLEQAAAEASSRPRQGYAAAGIASGGSAFVMKS